MELKQLEDRFAFEHVQGMANQAADMPGDVGLVVGLTNVSSEILGRVADIPLLVPGLGAQGGNLEDLQVAGRKAPLLINSSRSILYGNAELSFADKAKGAMDKIAATLG
jgi:orotidine-5'-phosphate decarboxylase